MYLPEHFAEDDPAELHRPIKKDYPLGTLVTLGADGLNANHLPFELHADVGSHGALRTHVARNNAVWPDFSASTRRWSSSRGRVPISPPIGTPPRPRRTARCRPTTTWSSTPTGG